MNVQMVRPAGAMPGGKGARNLNLLCRGTIDVSTPTKGGGGGVRIGAEYPVTPPLTVSIGTRHTLSVNNSSQNCENIDNYVTG